MLKNNNQEIVRKIAFRSMKQNRIRNGIVILAVILTTFMFTTIFTIGASMAEGMMVMLTRQQGTRSSIYLNNPTKNTATFSKHLRLLRSFSVRNERTF